MASVVIAGDVSGTCTLQAANAAGTTVLTLPTTSGTLVATNGSPTFVTVTSTTDNTTTLNATTGNITTVTAGLGNASAPSITFTGDTNTGIFSPSADAIAFTEGGTESMRITSAGDVGIGTSSPAVKFEVSGTVVASGLSARVTNTDTDASTRAGIQFKTGASANVWQTFTRNNQLVFGINAVADYMAIDGSGNLQFNSGYGSAATAYGCRAWVNFNGQGGASIRGSGNISSVTRNSAGDYTITFSNSMPDTNYAPIIYNNADSANPPVAGSFSNNFTGGLGNFSTSSFRVTSYSTNFIDSSLFCVAVFR